DGGELSALCGRPGSASALARASRGKSLDLRATARSPADRPSGSNADHSPGTGKPAWGYQRIVGELKGLGVVVSATSVKQILREQQLGPAGKRRGPPWREVLRAPGPGLIR